MVSDIPAGDGNIEKLFLRFVPVAGIQGQDIGDVKFNQDGDAMGRYSVYQYQQVENTHDPKGEIRLVRARYVRDAHTDRVCVQKANSGTKSRQKS